LTNERSLPQVTSACSGCAAGCCRSFNLAVNGFDAYRLGRDLQLPLADFVELRWVPKPDDEHRVRLSADPADARHHRLVLRRVPEPLGEHADRCVFLLTIGAGARCGVYLSRPSMCRVYPTFMTDGIVGTHGGKYCPPGAWQVENLELARLREEHVFKSRQQKIYHRLIDGWNARVRVRPQPSAPEAFFDYLVNLYRELERRHAELFVEPMASEPDDDFLDREVERALHDLGWMTDEPVPSRVYRIEPSKRGR
jgi:Fe-S-cluster containining protein